MKSLIISMLLIVLNGAVLPANAAEHEIIVPVTDVYVPDEIDSHTDVYVVVTGLFPNGCYSWLRADVTTLGNLHEIRNIASVSEGLCTLALIPFTKKIQLGRFSLGTHVVRVVVGDGTYTERTINIER